MQLRYRGVSYEIRSLTAAPQDPETAYRWIRDDLQMQYRGVKIYPTRPKLELSPVASHYSTKYRGVSYRVAALSTLPGEAVSA
jgi:hypothetical protein